jgi:hypothetical protein
MKRLDKMRNWIEEETVTGVRNRKRRGEGVVHRIEMMIFFFDIFGGAYSGAW